MYNHAWGRLFVNTKSMLATYVEKDFNWNIYLNILQLVLSGRWSDLNEIWIRLWCAGTIGSHMNGVKFFVCARVLYEHLVKILGWSEDCIRWQSFSVFRQNLGFDVGQWPPIPNFLCDPVRWPQLETERKTSAFYLSQI